MNKKHALAAAMFGIALMTLGITGQLGETLGTMSFVLGFVLMVSGMLLTLKQERGVTSKKKKEEKDSPAFIRATGVVVGLASLAAPYFDVPVDATTKTAYSVMDLALAMMSGVEIQINFMMFVLVTVLLVGSFISVFHHSGGYIILLGGMTAVFLAMGAMGSLEAVWEELGYGLYLMLFAGIVIVSSVLADTSKVYDAGTDWVNTTLVS